MTLNGVLFQSKVECENIFITENNTPLSGTSKNSDTKSKKRKLQNNTINDDFLPKFTNFADDNGKENKLSSVVAKLGKQQKVMKKSRK